MGGSSESVVLNGNIDGFLIAGNRVHDNNNIGIDMIGFEGTAMHPDQDSEKNQYEADRVRNGICRDNIIYNISAEGNEAYFEDGDSWTDEYGKLYADREEAAEEFRFLIDDVGSRFVPDEDMMELYRENAGMEE